MARIMVLTGSGESGKESGNYLEGREGVQVDV